MMLSLGISRLTTAQRYALADGLLERLPERINLLKWISEKLALCDGD